MSELGKHIKHELLDLDMTQNELAAILDVRPSYVSALVNNDTKPSAAAIERVGVALGVSETKRNFWHEEAIQSAKNRLVKRYWERVESERDAD